MGVDSHLRAMTLQPVYRAPRLLLWNRGLSWSGQRESALVRGSREPQDGHGGMVGRNRPPTRCCMRLSVMLNFREPGRPMRAE